MTPIGEGVGVPMWAIVRSREEFNKPELPMLTVISELGVRVRNLADGRAPSDDLSGYRVVDRGDLVVNKLWARFGAYGVSEDAGIISPAYWVLSIDRGLFEPRFLHHLLRSTPYRAEIWRRSKDQPPNGFDLPWDQFRTVRVPLLSLATQCAIADYLDAATARIDALIEMNRRMIQLVQERRQARLDLAFEPGVLRRYRLKHLLAQSPCYGVLVPRFEENGVPFIRVNDLPRISVGKEPERTIDPSQSVEYRRTVVNEGDVLLSVVGSVEKVAVVSAAAIGANVARAVARLVPKESVPPGLLALWLQTTHYLDQARLETVGDTAQPTLNMSDLARFVCWFPEQGLRLGFLARLQDELAPLEAARSLPSQQISLLRERRQALITAAVTGELKIVGSAA